MRMTDIVYKLRHPAWVWTHGVGSQLDKDETLIDLADAADEIERLRSQLAKANDPTRDDTSSDLDIDLPKARPMGQS